MQQIKHSSYDIFVIAYVADIVYDIDKKIHGTSLLDRENISRIQQQQENHAIPKILTFIFVFWMSNN